MKISIKKFLKPFPITELDASPRSARVFVCLVGLMVHSAVACDYSHLGDCSAHELKSMLIRSLEPFDPDHSAALEKELVSRQAIREALQLLNDGKSLAEIHWGAMILTDLRSPAVDKALRPLANREVSLTAYEANLYFAKKGRKFALKNLNANYYQYPVSSFAWAETVRLFGVYKFRPAAANLVQTISAASLNLADASIDALIKIYDVSPDSLRGLTSEKEFATFFERILKHRNGDFPQKH